MQLEKAKRSERTGNQQCVHHWVINAYNIGRCIKPSCGAVRDFGALLKKEPAAQMRWLDTTLPRRKVA